ncbi:MAG: (2Fe-2S)-binding protein [Polyangiaceae bacterium]|nr:(2Fe-2S)-binding protein [Polyangiaceae bacterium]MCW5790417.1 (2Fe-2S)-binding protein [Polyangiaceae bacterium]
MLVCHCYGINDRTIRECVRAGCSSARGVSKACGAGTDCGGCARLVKSVVREELQRLEGEGPCFHLPMAELSPA